jgi:hypothetical protein
MSQPTRFRKKPVVIEAFQWDDTPSARKHVREWVTSFIDESPDGDGNLSIATLEGWMRVSLHDWIIKGVKGEFYPCKPDIFEATYDPAD